MSAGAATRSGAQTWVSAAVSGAVKYFRALGEALCERVGEPAD
jgi:hypothetical protein